MNYYRTVSVSETCIFLVVATSVGRRGARTVRVRYVSEIVLCSTGTFKSPDVLNELHFYINVSHSYVRYVPFYIVLVVFFQSCLDMLYSFIIGSCVDMAAQYLWRTCA